MNLNERTSELCHRAADDAQRLKIAVGRCESGATLLDFGVHVAGGLEAGRVLAQICMANLGRIDFVPGHDDFGPGPAVLVSTDHPIASCMASQYAGWQVSVGKFFAMGSGPMRSAAGREELFDKIGCREKSDTAVGVLESARLPSPDVCRQIAEKCQVDPTRLTLAVAPTASQAGTVQIVARSIETALHKMLELGLDLRTIESGQGLAPLPPVAADDLAGIGRTNDAILYGGQVTLWLRGDDQQIESIGKRIPSCSSEDHGRPFTEIFKRYDGDFYKIDPHLFSPAVIMLNNLDTGNSFRFGHLLPRVIHQSFGIIS